MAPEGGGSLYAQAFVGFQLLPLNKNNGHILIMAFFGSKYSEEQC